MDGDLATGTRRCQTIEKDTPSGAADHDPLPFSLAALYFRPEQQPGAWMTSMTILSNPPIMSRVWTGLLVVLALLCASCAEQRSNAAAGDGNRPSATVRETADDVVAAFQARDGARLAAFVHPVKGVRFSPSAYVDVNQDRVFPRDRIAGFWTDTTTYPWGYADGSGNPIELTPAAYANRYILDRDFSRAPSVNIDADRAAGTTRNNAGEVYPAATRVEYYIEPSGGTGGGHDWAALRLVFEDVDGSWRLVGVIRDEWSI
jgi:hypothetical protein